MQREAKILSAEQYMGQLREAQESVSHVNPARHEFWTSLPVARPAKEQHLQASNYHVILAYAEYLCKLCQ